MDINQNLFSKDVLSKILSIFVPVYIPWKCLVIFEIHIKVISDFLLDEKFDLTQRKTFLLKILCIVYLTENQHVI